MQRILLVSLGRRLYHPTMTKPKVLIIVLLSFGMLSSSTPECVMAQAFGEYGRAVGSIPRGQGKAPGTPGSTQRRFESEGVGGLGGKTLPKQLIVTSKQAALFPRQDDKMEKIGELSEGDRLLPLIQSEGSDSWFMVKTEKGIVGWVKSSDVRREVSEKK